MVFVLARQQATLNTFTDETKLGTHKRLGYTFCKDDRMAYSLSMSILFDPQCF